jgi:scyllo-inosamine-4-phosphate amidinotransferase 1
MKINTHNDWDPLEEIIVGHAHHYRVNTDISSHSFSFADKTHDEIKHMEGPIPQWVIDEANEDVDIIANIMTKLGIKVHRPAVVDWSQEFSTYDWSSRGWQSWCPRDLIINLGDMLIETPSPVRSRYFETAIYRDILYQAFDDDALWISAPKPRLLDSLYNIEGDTRGRSTLLDHEICFDAPNIVRVGRDLLYQISNSGNLKGFRWLKRLLEPMGYRLHYSELYSYAHFDSTIIPLQPGLVLLNSSRVNEDNCPEIFRKWDKIWFEDCVLNPSKLDGYLPPCSPYIGMNILSIDPTTVMVTQEQTNLIKVLESRKFTVIPVRLRHSQMLNGGLHCCTLDLRRKGTLEDYCS